MPISERNEKMPQRHNRRHSDIQKIAIGAILAALTCVFLLIGGILELLDMTSAAVASAAVLVSCVLFGKRLALSVYAVSAILTFLLMPTATSTIYYGLLLGWYPILKIFLEQKMQRKLPRLFLKLLAFNVGVGMILFLFVKLYGITAVLAEFSIPGISTPLFAAVFFVLLNVFLLAYDRLLTYGAFFTLKFLHGRKTGRNESFHKK